jgi:hypothetical protein
MIQSGKRILPALLALVAGAVVVLPAILFGMPKNNDLANHYHFAIPFYDALGQRHLYPGWLAAPNFGYGDAVVRFYPPALYYLLAAGRAVTGNWYAGSLSVITFLSALGSFAAYFWARSYVPRNVAVWAGLFYALMPYHLAEFYQAAQLAEFAAGAALLFALAFTKRVCDERRWRDVAGLAIAYAALILSHLPLAVFGSLTLLLYTLLNLSIGLHQIDYPLPLGEGKGEGLSSLAPSPAIHLPRGRGEKLRIVKRLLCAVLLGLGASAFYWVTMVSEMKWIVADGPNPDPMLDYRQNFVFSTFSADKHETLWWMAMLSIATMLMCVPAVAAFLKSEQLKRRRALIAVAIILSFSFLMSTAMSKPVWAIVPYLRMAQHPFRWLAVTSTIAPVLMAAAIPFWKQQFQTRRRPLALLMSGLVLIAVTFSISQTVRGATYLSRTTFEKILSPLREAPGIIQWLPVWASASAHDQASYEKCIPPKTTTAVEAGNRAVHIDEWSDLKRSFDIEAGAPSEARVATFYYPHWVANANGQALPTRPAADGALLISLPSERVTVNLEFREPARRKLSAAASIISWTLVASLLIFGAFVRKRRDHEPTAI